MGVPPGIVSRAAAALLVALLPASGPAHAKPRAGSWRRRRWQRYLVLRPASSERRTAAVDASTSEARQAQCAHVCTAARRIVPASKTCHHGVEFTSMTASGAAFSRSLFKRPCYKTTLRRHKPARQRRAVLSQAQLLLPLVVITTPWFYDTCTHLVGPVAVLTDGRGITIIHPSGYVLSVLTDGRGITIIHATLIL